MKEKIVKLNEMLHVRNQPKKETRPVRQVLKKLEEDCLVRLQKYEQEEETLAGRSSFT